jgi:hypothetical protein
MHDAAGRFPEGDLRGAAAVQIANGLGAVADHIREKDLSDIPADLSAFARRNPALFFAGAAALGFVAARMMKATSPEPQLPATSATDDDFRGAA